MTLRQHALALLVGSAAIVALGAFIYAVVHIKAVGALLVLTVALVMAYAVGLFVLDVVRYKWLGK